MEISNSHGPDPACAGRKRLSNTCESSESSGSDAEIDDADYVDYTPDKYLKIGEKICDTLYEIYSEIF